MKRTNVARLCVTEYWELSPLGMWNYSFLFIATLLGTTVNNVYMIIIFLALFIVVTVIMS